MTNFRLFRIQLFFVCLILGNSLSWAETIVLKNGQIVEGAVIGRSDKYLKVSQNGKVTWYNWDDVQTVDAKTNGNPTSKDVASSNPEAASPSNMFTKAFDSVVLIRNKTLNQDQMLGSGFIVSSDGVIVTNYHVVNSSAAMSIRLKDGREFTPQSIMNYDKKRDICILRIGASNLPALKLGTTKDLAAGAPIYTVGNPLGLEYSVSNGLFSSKRDKYHISYLQFTAPISPGNSGGPLLNQSGKAIGVNTFYLVDGQNLNFALDVEELKPLLQTDRNIPFEEFVRKVSQVEYLKTQANQFLDANKWDKAEEIYNQAIALDPNDPELFDFRGRCRENLWFDNRVYANNSRNYLEEAIDDFNKAVFIDPNYFWGLADLGQLLSIKGDSLKNTSFIKTGVGYLKQAETLLSDNTDKDAEALYGSLVSANLFLQQFSEAQKYVDKIFEIDPKSLQGARMQGEILLAQGKIDEALTIFGQMLSAQPQNFDLLMKIAGLYEQKGDLFEAERRYKAALEIGGKNYVPLYSLAKISLKQSDLGKAWQYLESLKKIEMYCFSLNWNARYNQAVTVDERTANECPQNLGPAWHDEVDQMRRSILISWAKTYSIVAVFIVAVIFWLKKRKQKTA
ncbi:MAG: trypsin-like peptidase domain-containing protein [Candidatus Omnitrophica bacterium]|nr:trypsin-like peptidase domain-containing protein [Candidatus Omnitrophota bacterium]